MAPKINYNSERIGSDDWTIRIWYLYMNQLFPGVDLVHHFLVSALLRHQKLDHSVEGCELT